MSINVHVTGNPISINRGKMVTTDLDHTKKEFDKRRLMRLEQVRQQSKDIAEDVRNKVRKEKSKQMKQIEKEGEAKLRSWQNRKLLELQTQYEEALTEFGAAHREADTFRDESEVVAKQREAFEAVSQERGRLAMTKAQQRKHEEQLKKSSGVDRKKIVREMEDTRSAMVSRMSQNEDECRNRRKKRRASADINISIPDSDSTGLSRNEENEPLSSCDCTDASELQSTSQFIEQKYDSRKPPKNNNVSKDIPPQSKKISSPSRRKSPISYILPASEKPSEKPPKSPPKDNRISERIKRRALMASQTKYCDTVAETQKIPYIESNTKIRDAIDARLHKNPDLSCFCGNRQSVEIDEKLNVLPHPHCICRKSAKEKDTQATQTNQKELTSSQKFDEIPVKPFVKLKSSQVDDNLSRHSGRPKPSSKDDNLSSQGTKMSAETSKVQFYDHPNRFQYERNMPRSAYVEKIPTESLQVIPDEVSEAEWSEQIKKRDKEAQMRGKQALDKEHVRKHYEEMMKKLPLLQKKERIGEIFNDKPEYHMSEERLKEKERVRQNNLENAFNKRFPNLKPAPVTLPQVPPAKEDARPPSSGSVRSLNVAEWDADFPAPPPPPKTFTAREVHEIVRAFTDRRPEERRAKLKQLLRHLRLQREQLIEEMRALPPDDGVDALLNDLRSFGEEEEGGEGGKKGRRKRRERSAKKRYREEKDTSAESSVDGSAVSVAGRERRNGAGKSPRKKAKTKSRRRVLVLQNTSTQTTPKQPKRPSETTSAEPRADASEKPCDRLHVPCDCDKENGKRSSEEVCQIVIELREDDDPSVVVKSKEKKSVGVGTEESPEKGASGAKAAGRKEKKPVKRPTVERSRSTPKTWKDQLSKNSISTASTSYLSPPSGHKTIDPRASSAHPLRKQPQQAELSSAYHDDDDTPGKGSSDPEVFRYVEKLLGMARESVANLGVSASDVQTPSQSVVEMESNRPGMAGTVYDILKAFPFKIGDVADALSYSPEPSAAAPPNTSVASSVPHENGSAGALLAAERADAMSARYADVTDSCSRRIAALAAMIRQIRHEKVRMLQVPKSESPASSDDRDFSTEYMALPEAKEAASESSSGSGLDEEEIYRRLLEIDLSLAEKLRRFEGAGEKDEAGRTRSSSSKKDPTPPTDTHEELVTRLQRLKHPAPPTNTSPTPSSQNHASPLLSDNHASVPLSDNNHAFGPLLSDNNHASVPLRSDNNHAFVPFLSDIPKLPAFEALPLANHKRPPPSKALTHVDAVPHELSTIAEADSQLSFSVPDRKIEDTSSPQLVSSSSSSCSLPKPPAGKSSSSSGDDVESMLRSIGMEWAVPTLRKTREAMALTSSSGSDLSEASLREMLRRQLLSRISSSTLRSDGSPGCLFSDLSGIQAGGAQRTSTPVTTSKSGSKSKLAFSGDSDLSSVKNEPGGSREG